MDNKLIIIKLIGVIMVIDGIWSLVTKKNNHQWLLDVGRVCRVALGGALLYM